MQACASNRVPYQDYKHQIVGPTLRYLIDYETLARKLGVARPDGKP